MCLQQFVVLHVFKKEIKVKPEVSQNNNQDILKRTDNRCSFYSAFVYYWCIPETAIQVVLYHCIRSNAKTLIFVQ